MWRVFTALAASLVLVPQAASAWTRPGHMVTAAIAYDDIARRRPDLLAPIGALLEAHPDRAPFQVAVDRSAGAERVRRMVLECARWPDDARQTPYDHPTWHAAMTPVLAADTPADVRARWSTSADAASGEAFQALDLNLRLLGDARAAPAERAVALCWVLHIAGDLHQPLHTAEWVSAAFPDGDYGGSKRFVLDPLTHLPISLHWLWDDSVNRSGAVADVDARARVLESAYPRDSLPELRSPPLPAQAWVRRESYALAQTYALGEAPPSATTEADAPPVPDPVWREVRRKAEVRVAVAGYRIADIVIAALDAAPR